MFPLQSVSCCVQAPVSREDTWLGGLESRLADSRGKADRGLQLEIEDKVSLFASSLPFSLTLIHKDIKLAHFLAENMHGVCDVWERNPPCKLDD